MIRLTEDIRPAVEAVFNTLPLYQAMPSLVVAGNSAGSPHIALVEKAVMHPTLAGHAALRAALWLYVDELDRSHTVSQGIETPTGSYWHGIMHRREGDFSNSHHWFRRAADHPAMPSVGSDYDADAFIDEVEAAHRTGDTPANLVDLQRREWVNLWNWCIEHGS